MGITIKANQFMENNSANDLLLADSKGPLSANNKINNLNVTGNSNNNKDANDGDHDDSVESSNNNHITDDYDNQRRLGKIVRKIKALGDDDDRDESNNNNNNNNDEETIEEDGSSSSSSKENNDHEDDEDDDGVTIKCSAVHTLERDMPTFDYSHLVAELWARILDECSSNEGLYSQKDIEQCKEDDWHLSRFLLRQKLDVDLACEMLKKTMRFHHESLFSYIRAEDFPAEFYHVGGLFSYEPDRKGNKMLYIRAKVHRKITEIQAVLQTFLYYNIHLVDQLAGGKGMSMVIDCSGGGIANADMEMVMFLLTVLMNYFPKGLSYILVHELPWILKPFWLIAKAWVPEEHRDLIKFSNSRTIFEYVDKENLPDYMGGTCERDYRAAPGNCTTLRQAAKLYGIEPEVVKRILKKFADQLPPQHLEKVDSELEGIEQDAPPSRIEFADRR